MHDFITTYRSYLKFTLSNMDQIQKNIQQLKSYTSFCDDIEKNKIILQKMYDKSKLSFHIKIFYPKSPKWECC